MQTSSESPIKVARGGEEPYKIKTGARGIETCSCSLLLCKLVSQDLQAVFVSCLHGFVIEGRESPIGNCECKGMRRYFT